ncbi:hypothetical protein INT48_001564, partial [Thamnidium elegans]
MKVSDTLNNYGKVEISGTSAIPATINDRVEGKHQYEEVSPDMGQASFPDNHLIKVTKGKNHYPFVTPSATAESPHMPKLRKTQLERLKKMRHFGTYLCTNDQTFNEYKTCMPEQMKDNSLRSLEMFDCLVSLLKNAFFANFNETLCIFKPDFNLTTPSKAFLDIIKYKAFSVHVVTTQVTLCEMYFYDENNWNVLEKELTNWNDRIFLGQYFELLATLFKGVLKMQEILKKT